MSCKNLKGIVTVRMVTVTLLPNQASKTPFSIIMICFYKDKAAWLASSYVLDVSAVSIKQHTQLATYVRKCIQRMLSQSLLC